MADIFISYASSNRAAAQGVAQALVERGHGVWWDREIVTGEAFDLVIERELMAARCVVVLWSAQAVASEWVKNEAAAAAERGVLLPAMLDATRPPLEFRRRQSADLQGFAGEPAHPGFEALCRGVDRLLGKGPGPTAAAPPKAPAAGPKLEPRNTARVLAGLALMVAAALAIWSWPRSPGESAGSPASARSALPEQPRTPAAAATGLPAELDLAAVEGTYEGEITADSRGPSQTHVLLQVQVVAADRLRISSANPRIGSLEVPVLRAEHLVLQSAGESSLSIDTRAAPMRLALSPRHELAYVGQRRAR